MADRQQVYEAIRRADAAGDRASVERLGRYLREMDAPKQPADNSRSRGFLGGALRPLDNAATWFANTPVGAALDRAGQAIGLDSTAGAVKKNDALRRGNARTGYQMLGNIAGTLPTLALPGGAFVQGAAGGALLTDKPNDLRSVARDAVIGGVGGKAGDLAGKRVIAPLAERAGRTQTARRIGEGLVNAVNRIPRVQAKLPPRAPAITRPERTIAGKAESGVLRRQSSLPAIRQNVADAVDMNLPYALADADPKLQKLAGSVARFSPEAQRMAQTNLMERSDDQGVRAIQGVRDYLHPTADIKAVSQGIRDAANRKSGPYYDKAFEGGSMAPLETQFAQAFDQTSKGVADAAAELAAAQRAATVSSAQVNRAGNNVYMNAQALPANRGAQSGIAAAERNLANARAAHEQTLSMLRRAQGDAASDAPGAVWSPRVQQFLDDPIAKGGLGKGMEIQRLEALAQGKPFDPTELAITGMDDLGNPVVDGVPNMRTLDAVKKGLDAIIDEYPKDFRGKPVLDERGRVITQVLQSFRGEVDSLNPDYAAAREVYARTIAPRDALQRGFDSTGKNVANRDLQNIVGGYNPKELAQARSGYATKLTDTIAGLTDSADPYRAIAGGINRREKLQTMFPGGVDDFMRLKAIEDQMTATKNTVLGNSATQGRGIDDQAFMGGDVASGAIEAAVQLGSGGGIPGAGQVARFAAPKIKDRLAVGGLRNAQARADELAPQLFDTSNPRAILDFLDELTRKQAQERARQEAYRRGSGLLGIPFGSGIAAGFAGQ